MTTPMTADLLVTGSASEMQEVRRRSIEQPSHVKIQAASDMSQFPESSGAARGVVEEDRRFPYRFFVVAFAWSWLMWLPLLLAGAGIIPHGKNLLSGSTVLWISLGAFGPAAGAFYSLRTSRGEDAVRQYLRGLLDLRFGWQAWLAPPLVLGGTTWLAWILPELGGVPHLQMLLPSVWAFIPFCC